MSISTDFGCFINNAIIPENRWRHYMLAMVMLQYVLPLLAITYAYGHMAKVTTSLYSSSVTRACGIRGLCHYAKFNKGLST